MTNERKWSVVVSAIRDHFRGDSWPLCLGSCLPGSCPVACCCSLKGFVEIWFRVVDGLLSRFYCDLLLSGCNVGMLDYHLTICTGTNGKVGGLVNTQNWKCFCKHTSTSTPSPIHFITRQKRKGNPNLLSTRCAVEKTQYQPRDLKRHHSSNVTWAQALSETVLLGWTVILRVLSLPSCSRRVKLNVLFKPNKISHFEHNKKG